MDVGWSGHEVSTDWHEKMKENALFDMINIANNLKSMQIRTLSPTHTARLLKKNPMDTIQDIMQMRKGSDLGTEKKKRLPMEKRRKRRRSEILLLFVNVISAKTTHQILSAKVVDKLEMKYRTIIKTYGLDHFQDCSFSLDSHLFL